MLKDNFSYFNLSFDNQEGVVQMPKYMAERYLQANPRLQAIVNGEKVPAAKVLGPTATTETVRNNN